MKTLIDEPIQQVQNHLNNTTQQLTSLALIDMKNPSWFKFST